MSNRSVRNSYVLARHQIRLFLESIWYRVRHRGNNFNCGYCGFQASAFKPVGYSHEILSELKIVGGGYRVNALCPRCNSTDRERLSKILIDDHIKLAEGSSCLLVAPERNLSKLLSSSKIGAIVTLCDLDPDRYIWANGIERQDVTCLTFEANSFDLVICNHVLEHVPDDRKAMEEIFRVLKPDGFAILQIPYSNHIANTDEDPELVDEKLRIKRFGQKDHVRIYTVDDYERRMEEVGFTSRIQSTETLQQHLRFGINPNEVGLLFKKAGVGLQSI